MAHDPYRDERESLRAEVARLRARSGRPRHWLGLALGGLALHLLARQLLGGWLNGDDDARFWAALAGSLAPLVGSLLLIALAVRNHRG